MPSYTAPVKDMQFVLHDVLKISEADIPGYADLERSFTEAVFDEAAKVASDILTPLNAVGDREGCRLENGVVRTPTGFKAAFETLRQGGWMSLDASPDYGGQGLPYLMHTAVNETFVSANMAFNMYQGLTHGAYSAILVHGTDEQKAKVAAEDGQLRMDRHHEPDRTALRHRSGDDAHQGRTAGRWLLQDHRPEDLHLGR
jgi:hypothetical protein